MNCKKISDLDKMRFFIILKNDQICHHYGQPFALIFPWFGMSCDSSRFFFLTSVKFSSVAHAKCWKGASCMDYKAKFTEVKQVRRVKPEPGSAFQQPNSSTVSFSGCTKSSTTGQQSLEKLNSSILHRLLATASTERPAAFS